jgi:hypothetical protein
VVSSNGIVPPAITAYPLGKTSPLETITDGVFSVSAMTFDSAGSLYVASVSDTTGSSSISVYAPGSTSPQQTITKDVAGPVAMVFDPSGNLYVANSLLHGQPAIAVYSWKKRWALQRTNKEPSQATAGSIALALDSSGKLYALLPYARVISV